MKFMSDARQETLIKSAEAVLDLMKLDVAPNAALKKIAAEEQLNAKEISLVSSAVNNSQTLAQLQTKRDGEKHYNFPITNAKTVVNDLFPDAKDELSQSAIDRRLDKKAVDESYFDYTDYRFDHDQAVRDFRSSFQVQKTASVAHDRPDFEGMRLKIEEAQVGFTAARDAADVALGKVAHAFRLTDAPKFDRFEKIARTAGVTEALIDMVYVLGNLESIGQRRGNVKEASTLRATPVEYRILQDIVHADTMWKQAADYLAVADLCKEELAAAEKSYYSVKQAMEASIEAPIRTDMSSAHFDNLLSSGLGGENIHDSVLDVAGIRGGTSSGKELPKSPLPTSVQQGLKNYETRSAIEKLMADPYVGKHDLPDVIDAYNRAISVNPRFGEAELTSYIRNDLATEGGVPLDLQLRASKAHSSDKGDDA
jgi:hypothetical protein